MKRKNLIIEPQQKIRYIKINVEQVQTYGEDCSISENEIRDAKVFRCKRSLCYRRLPRNVGLILYSWCGPCKQIAPYLEKRCESQKIPLIKVDVDKASQLAAEFNVTSMPTFAVIALKSDNVMLQKIGGSQTIVDQIIKEALKHK